MSEYTAKEQKGKKRKAVVHNEKTMNMLIKYVGGHGIEWTRAFHKYKLLIGPLNIPEHWMMIVIDLTLWTMTIVDSNANTLKRVLTERKTKMKAFAKGFPEICKRGGYFEDAGVPINIDPLKIIYLQEDLQPVQEDSFNCGIYVCKAIEEMMKTRIVTAGSFDTQVQRRDYARRIYANSILDPDPEWIH